MKLSMEKRNEESYLWVIGWGSERFHFIYIFFLFKVLARQKKVRRKSIEEMVMPNNKKVSVGREPLFNLAQGGLCGLTT